MQNVKSLAVSVALVAASVALSPVAQAHMTYGNYRVESPRDPGHSWLWALRPCEPSHADDCLQNQAQPRPNGQATPWYAVAHLANNQYTMTVDVPDGVRCLVYFLPSHDVYTWDATTLNGSVTSTFDKSCNNGPGGTADWPFNLVRE